MKLLSRKPRPAAPAAGEGKIVRKNANIAQSITVAALGLVLVLRTEKSVRLILYWGVSAVLISLWLKAPYIETTFLTFSWMITMTFEIFNTSLEKAMDYASGKEYHPLIKKGKDFAGASVFIASSFSLVLSAVIILNRITWHVKDAV